MNDHVKQILINCPIVLALLGGAGTTFVGCDMLNAVHWNPNGYGVVWTGVGLIAAGLFGKVVVDRFIEEKPGPNPFANDESEFDES